MIFFRLYWNYWTKSFWWTQQMERNSYYYCFDGRLQSARINNDIKRGRF